MPLSQTSSPYFTFLVIPLIIVAVFIGILFLFFRWYFRRYRENKTAKTIGILLIILPFLALTTIAFLASQRSKQLVEVVDVKCNGGIIFPGTVIVKDVATSQTKNIYLPMRGLEDGKATLLNSSGNPYESWYNSDFCQKGEVYEKEIKNRPLSVTTNGYGRIIEWQDTRKATM